ncbi:uncharacterized protein [Diabrotica undecimpunctata]|uniref:uncharacterized protein n=1 Tax=Diabrotica undecimpunctata TaxID=50387 RepID=UPI003B63FD02
MFNSSKLSDSPSYFKTNLTNIKDETINDTSRSILFPKITSTPLNSIFATPPKNKIMTPRRYSLSEVATPPRHNRREYVRSTTSKYQPGPLLASTKFNLSVSTFEDAKSPGLVNRIVQYNEETERQKEQRRPVTHQEKYGSVGLFPVVHLFKNKLPTLQKKPRHVTVRVASPDYVKHTPEYNRKLLEGLVNPTGGNHTLLNSRHSGNSTSTRSVLDALKEISRKRIHANEELELRKDAGKRLRTDNDDHVDSSKRLRDESLLQENTSPSKPVSKKICMYDEYAASRSSMDFAFKRTESTQPKRKTISISTLTENPKQTKEIKLQNAETQTLEEVSNIGNASTTKSDGEASKEDLENKEVVNVVSNDEVFDEGTLSTVRENRLASFLGTLIGKDAVLERSYKDLCRDEVDEAEPETEATTKAEKPLVSILSPGQKSTKKIEKHVTFKIPESTSQSIDTTAATSTEHSVGIATEKREQTVLPQSSVASKGDGISTQHGGLYFQGDSSGSSPVPCASGTFVNASTPSSIPFTPKSLSADAPKTIPSFNFGNKPAISSPSSTLTASSPKMGGFKFDLSKPAAPAFDSKVVSSSTITPNVTSTGQTTNTTPAQFSFGPKTSNTFGTSVPALNSTVSTFTSAVEITTAGSTVTATIPPITSVLSAPQNQTFAVSSTASNKPTFAFGTSSSSPNSSFTFGAKSEPSTTSSGFGSLKFGATSVNTITTSATTSFNTSTSVANKYLITSSSATNSFGTTSTVPAFGNANNSFQLPKTENAGFNNSTTTANTSGFGGQNTVGFGTATTTSSGFGNVTSFGNNTAPGFGTSGFGSTAASGFGTTTNPAFGTTTTSTPAFGTTTTPTPAFGTTTTPTPAFGTTTTPTPAFGNTKTPTPAFGTTTTPTPAFGTTTTPTPAFGNTTTPNPAFGTNPTPTPPFGGATNAGFGTATTGFGSTPSGFGVATTTSSNFGSTGSNVFGVTTTSSGFGGTFTSPATLNSPFGSNTSVNSNFGVSTTSVGGFGTSNTTKSNTAGFGTTTSFNFGPTTTTASTGFGGSTTTTQGFGTTTAPAFGTTPGSIFASTNVPSFGTTGSSFPEAPFGAATTSTPAFGTTTTTPSFNFGGNNKAFGGANTAFGAPTTTTNSVFGTTQSPFGSGMPTTSTSALPFAFTAKTTTSGTFPSTNTSTTSFGSNFGQTNSAFGAQNSGFGTQNKAPAFGNNTTPAFGSSVPTQGFGSPAQPSQPFGSSGSVFNKPQAAPQNTFNSSQFNFNQQQNSTPNQAPVFTFGAGANEKPGGFNFSGAASGETPKKFDFTGGNTAPPAFGTSFGTTPAVPAFGAPTTGGFSIGSGPRPRKQVTAKRRT